MLNIFTKYAIEQPGNWLSPGGKYKKFASSNSDLIFTWNYELGTLSFKGEMGDRLKELFITVCMTGKSLPAERSGFEHVALNSDKPLSILAEPRPRLLEYLPITIVLDHVIM
jgi:hypothetical protein